MVPLNLEATLRLNHGRAYVGFTAATGRDTWQVIGSQVVDRTPPDHHRKISQHHSESDR